MINLTYSSQQFIQTHLNGTRWVLYENFMEKLTWNLLIQVSRNWIENSSFFVLRVFEKQVNKSLINVSTVNFSNIDSNFTLANDRIDVKLLKVDTVNKKFNIMISTQNPSTYKFYAKIYQFDYTNINVISQYNISAWVINIDTSPTSIVNDNWWPKIIAAWNYIYHFNKTANWKIRCTKLDASTNDLNPTVILKQYWKRIKR